MNQASKINQHLYNSVRMIVDKELQKKSEVYVGRVSQIQNSMYYIIIDGAEYRIKFEGKPVHAINDIVNVIAPHNDFSRLILLNSSLIMSDGSGSGTGGTFDYNALYNHPSINGIVIKGALTPDQLGLGRDKYINPYQKQSQPIQDIINALYQNGGTTFTPTVSADATLSWSNDKGLPNPSPVNIRGPAGADGRDGSPGAKGDKGPAGAVGPKGDAGSPGQQGPTGPQGSKGDKGDTGPKGDTGERGPAGRDGQDGLTTSVNHIEQIDGNINLSAVDIPITTISGMSATNVQKALEENFRSVVDGKVLIETAIIDKGGSVSKVDNIATFRELEYGVRQIPSETPGGSSIEIGFERSVSSSARRDLVELSEVKATSASDVIGNELIVAGGYTGPGTYDSPVINAINPVTNTRRSLIELSAPRGNLSGCSIDADFIVAGGHYGRNLDVVEAINITTNTIRSLLSLSAPDQAPARARIGNEAIFGNSTLDAINPITNTKRSLPNFSPARNSMACSAMDEEIVFAGGGTSTGFLNSVESINVVTNTKRYLISLSAQKINLSASTVAEEVIFAGGYTYKTPSSSSSISKTYDTIDAINPKTNTRRSLVNLSEPKQAHTNGVVGMEVVYTGGWNGSSIALLSDAINPTTNTKRILDNLKQGRRGNAFGVIGSELVLAGGTGPLSSADYLSSVEAINPNPKSIILSPIIINNTLFPNVDVSLDHDCIYCGFEYPTGQKFTYINGQNRMEITNLDVGTIKGSYYIKQGDYTL